MESLKRMEIEKSMSALEYISGKCKWMPINIDIEWNEQKQKYTKELKYVNTKKNGYQPKCNDFQNLSERELKERQTCVGEYEYIALDTSEYYHIDVDKEPKMFTSKIVEAMKEQLPYYESVTKKLPHFLFKSGKKISGRTQTVHDGVEILAEGWAYCNKNAKMYNMEKEIPVVDVSRMINVEKIADKIKIRGKIVFSTLEKGIKGLNMYRCDEYDMWLNVIFAIIHTGEANGYRTKAETLAHLWSMKNEKYDKEYLDNVIKKYYKHDRAPTFGTVCHYLKEDNKKVFNEIIKETNTQEEEEHTDVSACHEFTKFVKSQGNHFAKCGGEIYWYNDTDGIWKVGLEDIRKLIEKCETLGQYQTSTRKQNDMLVQFKDRIKNDPEFHKKAYQTTLRKLAFNNGIYDFERNTLLQFSNKYIFFNKLQWDYEEKIDTNLVEEIKQKLFYDVFDKRRGEYFMNLVSRSIAGEVNDKTFNIVVGDGNSGKGVNSTINENAFGNFCMTFNAKNMAINKTQGDNAKARSWMVALQYARMAIANEVEMGMPLDGNKIKEFSGGGDTMCARTNFKDEINFKMQCTPFYFVNDVPPMKPMTQELKNRLKFIETQYSYLDGTLYEQQKHCPNVRQADKNIKDQFCTDPKVLKTYAIMICQNYKPMMPYAPEEVIKNIEEWTEADDVTGKISELFIGTENEEDVIKARSVYNIVKHAGVEISETKLGKLMNKLGFRKKDKKIEQKVHRVYTHIKKIENDEEF
jgi:phage/plasmid-associated DNA primase